MLLEGFYVNVNELSSGENKRPPETNQRGPYAKAMNVVTMAGIRIDVNHLRNLSEISFCLLTPKSDSEIRVTVNATEIELTPRAMRENSTDSVSEKQVGIGAYSRGQISAFSTCFSVIEF